MKTTLHLIGYGTTALAAFVFGALVMLIGTGGDSTACLLYTSPSPRD